jgi:formylglycine-generating enzyme required for sulfatase activity
MPVNLMVAIGKAALNLAGVGLVGDAVEIARAAWEDWKKSPEERLEELEAVVRADDEDVARAAEHVVAELAAGEPEPVRRKLATFLKQIPSRIRQSQRRPADPTGRTIRPGFVVSRPDDLIPYIPDQLPRFQAGDRPLPGVPWVLVELLGIGGFGEVWKASHAHLQSRAPMALKFCTDSQARRVLRHEAKVIDRVMLQSQQLGLHRGIVTLQDANLDSEPPYLQYDYVEGGDLGGLIGDWHRQAQRISLDQIARAMLQLAEIVAFAHRLDPPIVHRDLKPANILVPRSTDGELAFRITDFGIGGIAASKAIQTSRQVTSPSQFLATAVRGSGSYLYASPEQFEGRDPDPRDDVHALGVIWYQMMTGNLTRGPSVGQGWRKRFLDQGMPAAMLELLGSCFEEQEDRPADAGVLAERLAALLKPPAAEVKKGKMTEPAKPEPPKEIVKRPSVKEILEAARVKVSEPSREIVNSIGKKLIPAGEFQMGSTEADDERPRHLVTISRPFYVGVYPVTQREYMQLIKKNPSHFSGNDSDPVESVSWFDAIEFCNALSRKESLPLFYKIEGQTIEVADWNGTGYRLPTEAEWEYTCRAGTTTRYSFGVSENALDQYAWYSADSSSKPHPVGQKRPNSWGLHDMHGNVWEWCWDGYDADYYKQSPAIDPRGPERAAGRVIRGGSWRDVPQGARSASRNWYSPEVRSRYLGFRVARVQSSG